MKVTRGPVPAEQLARQWFGNRNIMPGGMSKRCNHMTIADVQSLTSLIEAVRRETPKPQITKPVLVALWLGMLVLVLVAHYWR